MDLNIDQLIKNYYKIHFFGLGFIQVKVSDSTRYHFYHKDLPAFTDHPHNHRYNFTSTCLKGRLKHNLYEVKGYVSGIDKPKSHILRYDACTSGKANTPESFPTDIEWIGQIYQSEEERIL